MFNVVCTIIFFTLFIGFFIWLIRVSRKGMGKLQSKLLFLFTFGGGWILATLSWVQPLVKSWNYDTVNAVVVNVEELEGRAPDTLDPDYDVTFQYTYNNVEYQGHIIYQADNQIPKSPAKLKCNPSNPTELMNFSLFWMGVVVTIAFGFVDFFLIKDFIYFIKNKGKEEEDPEYDSEIQSD